MPSGSAGLIVDVGMHDGSDTEFYLAKGFDVVAVEANPSLVEQVSHRLREPVREGRLKIHAVAVADHDGMIDFFLSDQNLWASATPDMADRGINGIERHKIKVPCMTLDQILADERTPHYVKIDAEGADPYCVEALRRLPELPRYVSFEADLTDQDETVQILDQLDSMGYQRFKLVNQATHASLRLAFPPLEGRYVDMRFTKHHSGPFGEESPGAWVDRAEVERFYRAVLRQQAARIEYSATGKVFGIPVSRFHKPLLWGYNLRPVTAMRYRWAAWRSVEPGGWFDIHAALG